MGQPAITATRKHKPLGLTCCLNEAAIFTALKLILPQGGLDELALLGSPAHYSVLAWTAEEAWWFYTNGQLCARLGVLHQHLNYGLCLAGRGQDPPPHRRLVGSEWRRN